MSRYNTLNRFGLSAEQVDDMDARYLKEQIDIGNALREIGCSNVIVNRNSIYYDPPYGWPGEWISMAKRVVENKPIYNYVGNVLYKYVRGRGWIITNESIF
jgi:hypothetical protein